jgi:hypothetical protein
VATARRELDRPAFYALRSGGWRDLVTLLHPPYTAWHLSYVALGAAAAPTLLDGRPLKTALSRRTLIGLGVAGLMGALAIGVAGVFIVSPLLIPLVLIGALLVPAYNLELAGGKLHNDIWFALSWGAFPAFTGYFANALTIRPAGVLVAAACFLLSVAQRRLSTPVRQLRRHTTDIVGEQRLDDGRVLELSRAAIGEPLEGALSALWLALVLLAVGLVAVRL